MLISKREESRVFNSPIEIDHKSIFNMQMTLVLWYGPFMRGWHISWMHSARPWVFKSMNINL
jgi:hypothetical protein